VDQLSYPDKLLDVNFSAHCFVELYIESFVRMSVLKSFGIILVQFSLSKSKIQVIK
jgi:hypothetical protein